jgi:hypothetical protein
LKDCRIYRTVGYKWAGLKDLKDLKDRLFWLSWGLTMDRITGLQDYRI